MEQISYWKNGKLIIKKFSSMDKLNAFVQRKGITQYYLWGYCFITL